MTSYSQLTQRPLHIDGVCDVQFQPVYETFKRNFENGLEREGAAFAMYYNGKLVVDVWGGYMDRMLGRKWERDTISIVMSCTKATTSIVVAMLVDSGFLDYDSLVTKYWPEFGQNGKEKITVKMLLSHQGGLCALDRKITYDDIRDWRKMSKLFEDQKPCWDPGTRYGYHAVTFGFLVEQLVRRTDPKHRSVGQFLAEEVTGPNDIDFRIGLPNAEFYRTARTTQFTLWDVIKRTFDPGYFKFCFGFLTKGNSALMERAFFVMDDPFPYVSPESFEVEIPAANGTGTARGLAKILSLVAQGKLISEDVIQRISVPVNAVNGEADCVMGLPLLGGWGFTHFRAPKSDHYLFGHCGYGGQLTRVDVKNKFAFAYIHNGFELDHEHVFPLRTVTRLQDSIYKCLNL